MKIKWILLVSALFVISTILLNIYDAPELNSSSENEKLNIVKNETPKLVVERDKVLEKKRQSIEHKKYISDSKKEVKEIAKMQLSPAQEFLAGSTFTNVDNLNKSFIYPDGVLSKSSVQLSFLNENYVDIIDKLESMESDAHSIKRHHKLAQQVDKTFAGDAFNIEHACAGKLCAITLQSYEQIESKAELINQFDSNYSFKNITQSEAGLYIYKGLFISTDDPSTMAIR